MRRIAPGLALLLILSGRPLAAEDSAPPSGVSPRIVDLRVGDREGTVLVSFRLVGALDAEARARIASGLETTYNYRLEVLRRRRFWSDARVRDHRILTSVKYDSLSRQYGLTLKLDGEVERSSTTDRVDEMERWLTSVKEISLGLASELLPAEQYLVRVKADFPLRFVWLFIPWDRDTPWARAPLSAPSVTSHEPNR